MNLNFYTVIDTETTSNNVGEEAVGKFSSNPHSRKNYIHMLGWKNENMPAPMTMNVGPVSLQSCLTLPPLHKIIVGHNLRFDLHYLQPYFDIHTDLNEYFFWDTQLAEYLLLGQQEMYPSLDDVAPRYGGFVKDGEIKAQMEAGVDVRDMNQADLKEYLEGDVFNTEIIFLGQIERAKANGMLPLILSQMDALKATWNMEKNGMKFDQHYANARGMDLAAEEMAISIALKLEMHRHFPNELHDQINPASNDHIALMLFGGTYSFVVKEPVMKDGVHVKYKSGAKKGKLKYKNAKKLYGINGLGLPKIPGEINKKGLHKTNDSVLQQLSKMKLSSKAREVIEMLLDLRRIKKDYSTYFKGYLDLVWDDGCIHGNINHCSTATGRLSSTAPNLQNVSSKDT